MRASGLAMLALTACDPPAPLGASCSSDGSAVLRTSRAAVSVSAGAFEMKVTLPDGTVLLETTEGPASTSVAPQEEWQEDRENGPWSVGTQVLSTVCEEGTIRVVLTGPGDDEPFGTFEISGSEDPRALALSFVSAREVPEGHQPRTRMTFLQANTDRFYGMGERFDEAEHSGNELVVWAAEGCAFNCEEETATFFPVPYVLKPPHLGVLLDDTRFSRWDFGKADPTHTVIEVDHDRIDLRLFVGEHPAEVTEAYTSFAGRIPSLPVPWVFAPWVSANWSKKGDAPDSETRTRELAAKLRAARVPTSGMWNEDWAGGTESFLYVNDLVANPLHYPNWGPMIEDMHADGFRVFAYFYPYLSIGRDHVAAADEADAVVRTPGGEVAEFWLLTNRTALDVTSPDAIRWWNANIYEEAAKYGVDGWMNDFGEYVHPTDRFADGRDGREMHNEYPRLWAQVAREYWDARRPDGDYVFFSRSGYTGSWKFSPVVWTGDHNTDWTQGDGLPSAIAAVTSLGISGAPIVTTDIGGFFCLGGSPPADRELFYRWTHLGAMLPVMREHNGMFNCEKNFLLDTDAESLAHWKTYAEFHTALFPLFYTLTAEARDRGLPVVRHLVLEFPNDPGPRARQDDQFLVGDRILVAPVIEQGAVSRSVWFPEGRWTHWQTGETFVGPKEHTVEAPLEVAPYFYRENRIIPMYDQTIDTLVVEDNADLAGFTDANASMEIRFYGEGRDTLTLWDGTRIDCDGATDACEVTGAPLERRYTFSFP